MKPRKNVKYPENMNGYFEVSDFNDYPRAIVQRALYCLSDVQVGEYYFFAAVHHRGGIMHLYNKVLDLANTFYNS